MKSIKSMGKLPFPVVCLGLALPFLAMAEPERDAVAHVRFEPMGKQVAVYYDLLGPEDARFQVTVSLRRESDKSFAHDPTKISGDVGRGVIPGPGKKIIWNLREDFPDGLPGDDFYFVVNADQIAEAPSRTMLWVGAGAAVVGGVAAYLLLHQRTQSEPGPAPGGAAFPSPPGRP